jgi:hypothetical protein
MVSANPDGAVMSVFSVFRWIEAANVLISDSATSGNALR